MGSHMRNHKIGTRVGTFRPGWMTIDKQPTTAFSVTLARCRQCGGALRAGPGGVWVMRSGGSPVCHSRRRWWGGTGHVIDATAPTGYSHAMVAIVLVVCVTALALVVLGSVFGVGG